MKWDKVKDLSMQELWAMVEAEPDHFRAYSSLYTYRNSSEYCNMVFNNLFDSLGLNLKGLNYLELGPGSGEGLDVAKSRGANTTFIDRDVLIARHCELKGHQLILCDYATPSLLRLNINSDVIIARGALNFDYWELAHYAIEFNILIEWMFDTGAKTIVITPAWERGETAPYHTCMGEKLNRVKEYRIHKHLISLGFKLYNKKDIENVEHENHLPITYIYDRV